jgi:hypothetical protein
MNAARRSIRRRDWPAGLTERRPGYFTWREPHSGKEHVIGRVSFAVARNESLQANALIAARAPSLVDKLSGAANTIRSVVDKMPVPEAYNTAKNTRSMDKAILAEIGGTACHALTVMECAELIEGIAETRPRMAQAVRSRLIAICARAVSLGWMDVNPAALTQNPRADVQRVRLTLADFLAIYAKAPEVNEWLQRAMDLAIVTGQDRVTIAGMKVRHIEDGHLIVWRQKTRKTNQPVAIPLALRQDAVGMSLADIVARKTGVLSPYLLHHVKRHRLGKPGEAVSLNTISKAFAKARDLAFPGREWGGEPPTFHEIRSLSKRLYDDQGGVDTKALFGWKLGSKMGDKYSDPRGAEALKVKIG